MYNSEVQILVCLIQTPISSLLKCDLKQSLNPIELSFLNYEIEITKSNREQL